MSLSGYDLRKRGGPRQTWRLRPRWRFPTPRELRLAGFVVYAGFVAWVMLGCDQLAARRQLSAWLGDRPNTKCENRDEALHDCQISGISFTRPAVKPPGQAQKSTLPLGAD
jgi:hypothetical protein